MAGTPPFFCKNPQKNTNFLFSVFFDYAKIFDMKETGGIFGFSTENV